jgi:hypothetical protein
MKNRIYFLAVALLTFVSGCASYCDNGQPKNGVQIENYSNGNVETKTEVKNCKCHGIKEIYYPSKVLQSKGPCLFGAKEGAWSYFSERGKLISESEWEKGELQKLKIYFGEKKNIVLDSSSAILSDEMMKADVNNPFGKLRMKNPDIQVLNDSLAGVSDYGKLIVISDRGAVLFDINTVEDSLFNKFFSKAVINYETADQFLKSGIEYDLKGEKLAISVYYNDSLSPKPLLKLFELPLIK